MVDKDFTGEQENDDTQPVDKGDARELGTFVGTARTDDVWNRFRRRETALSFAVATAGKNPNAKDVTDAAQRYLSFLEQ